MDKKGFMYMSLFLLWGVAAGMVSPVQTSINARLRVAVGSPFIASTISFFIATIVIVLLTLCIERKLTFDPKFIPSSPWWLWIGGFLGVIFVTANILLLPIIGSALTVVAIVSGQMLIALVIDHFGWFGVTQHKLNIPRLAGLVLLITGVLLIQHF
ncbi:DMT family transporter [Bacillaceae bacterium Marseille-Q3522]|nr:DMT family transporter [Bacillaceae bacterium Marseille-Q3522]